MSTAMTPPIVRDPTAAAAAAARMRRLIGAAVVAVSGSLLGLAAWMTPAGAGLGTHEQLNLPPCGWIVAMDTPCPTCGMTTSFAYAADGNIVQSFITQPLGCILAIVTGMAFLLGAHAVLTGSPLAGRLRRLWRPRSGWLLGGLVLVAWGYKIASYKGYL